jgi:hypothetical protein
VQQLHAGVDGVGERVQAVVELARGDLVQQQPFGRGAERL